MPTMPSHATTAEHLALAPPAGGHWGLPAGLAVGVHVLLAAALAWGVSWRDEPQLTAVSAELWSRLPQEAAPLPVTPPPPLPEPEPEQSNPTPPPPAPPSTAQAQEEADIALQQREKAKREREEALRLEQKRKETMAKEKAAKEKAAKAAKDKDKAKAEEARKQAEQKKQQVAQQKAEQAALDKNREEQIKRQMAQLGGASGSGGKGQASQSSGPSAGYAAKVAARIRPNIRFDDAIPGNPPVEVRVRTAPDGSIVSRTVHKTSEHPAWDQAALRAIDRTGTLPRDNDGRVPQELIIELRPKEQ